MEILDTLDTLKDIPSTNKLLSSFFWQHCQGVQDFCIGEFGHLGYIDEAKEA
jgi:hypothetical protein